MNTKISFKISVDLGDQLEVKAQLIRLILVKKLAQISMDELQREATKYSLTKRR